MNYSETYFKLDSEEATHCDHCHLICCVYIKGHVEIQRTQRIKSMLLGIEKGILFTCSDSVDIYSENYLESTRMVPYLVACSMQHVLTVSTYPGSCKNCFSRIPVFGRNFLLIFPIIYQIAHLHNWPTWPH